MIMFTDVRRQSPASQNSTFGTATFVTATLCFGTLVPLSMLVRQCAVSIRISKLIVHLQYTRRVSQWEHHVSKRVQDNQIVARFQKKMQPQHLCCGTVAAMEHVSTMTRRSYPS